MITKKIRESGLWIEDINNLKINPFVKDLEYGLEIDQYHYFAKYEIIIICERCKNGQSVEYGEIIKDCKTYICKNCNSQWVDKWDFMLYKSPNGKEILKQLRERKNGK